MHNKNKGSALLTALFIMTLVAIAATAMSTKLQLDIYRTNLTVRTDKLYLASQAVTFWSMAQLRAANKPRYLSKDKMGLIMSFPLDLQRLYPDAKISGGVYDLQARFNINNLLDKKYRAHFLRFLDKQLGKSTPQERKAIVDATVAWISEYRPGQGLDKLTAFYLKQTPPYVPSYQPLRLISEFRLIAGVDSRVYETLSPYITALPEATAVNLNTASEAVLMTLGNGLQASQAADIVRMRGEKGIEDLRTLNELLQRMDVPSEQVTLESKYYLCEAHAIADDLNITVYSVLKRNKDENNVIKISMVSSTINTL